MNMIYMRYEPSDGIEIKTPFAEHFYDGSVEVINSVCKVPGDKSSWVLRLEGLGFVKISVKAFLKARGLLQENLEGVSTRSPR